MLHVATKVTRYGNIILPLVVPVPDHKRRLTVIVPVVLQVVQPQRVQYVAPFPRKAQEDASQQLIGI